MATILSLEASFGHRIPALATDYPSAPDKRSRERGTKIWSAAKPGRATKLLPRLQRAQRASPWIPGPHYWSPESGDTNIRYAAGEHRGDCVGPSGLPFLGQPFPRAHAHGNNFVARSELWTQDSHAGTRSCECARSPRPEPATQLCCLGLQQSPNGRQNCCHGCRERSEQARGSQAPAIEALKAATQTYGMRRANTEGILSALRGSHLLGQRCPRAYAHGNNFVARSELWT
jgi:hypothetical protein